MNMIVVEVGVLLPEGDQVIVVIFVVAASLIVALECLLLLHFLSVKSTAGRGWGRKQS